MEKIKITFCLIVVILILIIGIVFSRMEYGLEEDQSPIGPTMWRD